MTTADEAVVCPTRVFYTSVLVAAARSRQGASYAQVASLPDPRFQICLSVAVYSERLSVLGFVWYLASLARLQNIHFLWRPVALIS
jgi:hypothetical protein